MSLFHQSLKRLLTGTTLSGQINVGGPGKPELKDFAVLVERVTSSEESHDWTLEVVVTPGGNGQPFNVKCDVRWARSTPVLTVVDADAPGLGKVSVKLMIHNMLFAGTWIYEGRRGQAWGALMSQHQPESQKRFVIERTSEFLREWWTGSGWSKYDRDARWYENEPDGPGETGDEEARPVCYPSGTVEAD